jgi:hypothetical protein
LRRNADERYQDVVELSRALAPLGTDELEAARVAKVANAARARVIGGLGEAENPTPVSTPIALTSSQLDIDVVIEDAKASSRRVWHWSLVGASVAAPMLAAVGYAAHGSSRSQAPRSLAGLATSSAPIAAVVAPAPPRLAPPPKWDVGAVSSKAAPKPTAAASAVRPAVSASGTRFRPVRATFQPVAASAPAAVSAIDPPVSSAAPPATSESASTLTALAAAASVPDAAPPPADTEAADAWDPKSFGGRR